MLLKRLKSLSMNVGLYPHFRYLHDRVLVPTRTTELRETMSLYSQFFSPGDLCFDVGANMGNKTEAMLRLGARVLSVEAHPGCVRELEARFKGNPAFQCVPKAVGREPGRAIFYANPTSQLSSMRPDWAKQQFASHESTPLETEITTLDQLIKEFGVPKFCKIDVEGMERDVLQGLSQPLKLISIEYHALEPALGETYECLERLNSFGQVRLNVSPGETFQLFSDDWWDYQSFLEFFRGEFLQKPEHFYGDIFIENLDI